MEGWSFLTNHARVLLCIAHDPGVRLRDIAASLGITERSAHGIITDLTTAGSTRRPAQTRMASGIGRPSPSYPARDLTLVASAARADRCGRSARSGSGLGREADGCPAGQWGWEDLD